MEVDGGGVASRRSPRARQSGGLKLGKRTMKEKNVHSKNRGTA